MNIEKEIFNSVEAIEASIYDAVCMLCNALASPTVRWPSWDGVSEEVDRFINVPIGIAIEVKLGNYEY